MFYFINLARLNSNLLVFPLDQALRRGATTALVRESVVARSASRCTMFVAESSGMSPQTRRGGGHVFQKPEGFGGFLGGLTVALTGQA